MLDKLKAGFCCIKIKDDGRWNYRQCSRKATVVRDGKEYCDTHDPENVKKRREASAERWRDEMARDSKRRRVESAGPELLDACRAALLVIEMHYNANCGAANSLRAAIASATGEKVGA